MEINQRSNQHKSPKCKSITINDNFINTSDKPHMVSNLFNDAFINDGNQILDYIYVNHVNDGIKIEQQNYSLIIYIY